MHPLNNGSQVENVPALKPRVGTPGYFSESNENGAPSYPGQDWFNAVIREFQTALADSGITFDPDSFDHLKRMLDARAPTNHTHSADAITSGTISNDRLNKASTSQQGIVQTSNSLVSTRSDQAASSYAVKSLKDLIDDFAAGFSSGQTWKSTSSRVFNVNYTNSNPYPIQIYVSARRQGSTGGTAFLIVDGVNVGWHNALKTSAAMTNEIFSAIIPAGSVYQVQTPNSDWSKTAWAELS